MRFSTVPPVERSRAEALPMSRRRRSRVGASPNPHRVAWSMASPGGSAAAPCLWQRPTAASASSSCYCEGSSPRSGICERLAVAKCASARRPAATRSPETRRVSDLPVGLPCRGGMLCCGRERRAGPTECDLHNPTEDRHAQQPLGRETCPCTRCGTCSSCCRGRTRANRIGPRVRPLTLRRRFSPTLPSNPSPLPSCPRKQCDGRPALATGRW
mmetsp:Transcript_68436/g.198456  ORF Transcript_68436/g.198456 Transcript_68436/m.198456 type:complete len:214 (-) Transcript_68436:22-663(-)